MNGVQQVANSEFLTTWASMLADFHAYASLTLHSFAGLPWTDHLVLGITLFMCMATHRLGMWPYSLMAFPGTACHELAHYVLAKLFFAKPTFPSLIPRRNGRDWTLGSITFVPGIFTTIPIALAPLLLIPAGIWYAVSIMSPASGIWYFVHAWATSSMFLASLPSRQDWKVAAPALLVAAGLAVAYLLALST